MTSKDIDLIKEMLKMQAKLDEAIMKEYGLKEIDEEKLSFAILDEVGELTHELKANWCWWKKTQTPVDNEKVLGELVDIWHFVLSWENHFDKANVYGCYHFIDYAENDLYILEEYNEMVSNLCYLALYSDKLLRLIAITEYLGFSIEQVYQAYCGKNKINYQRLENGY